MESPLTGKPDLAGRKILAVDDSIVNLRLLSVLLIREGFEVLTTSNSLETLPLALKHKPDLILLDIMMPGIDGMGLIRLLKSNSETSHIPLLMVTSRTRGEDVREALESGAFDFIKKPLDEIEITARVRSALRYKIYQDRLLEMAMRDSLTGLYNHALLMDLLDKGLYNARRRGQPLSYCMIDIDYFKRINDNHGHMAGDEVLRQIAAILSQAFRKGDPVGRYGGEEFGIILAGVDMEQACVLCERIREMVQDRLFAFDGETLKVTLSMGVATAGVNSSISSNELIQKADVALYQAKENGRNQLVRAPL